MKQTDKHTFRFAYDSKITRVVRKELLETIAKANPVQAELLRDDLEQRDIAAEFEQLFAPFQLRSNDVADAMLGYWLMMWSIIHRRELPEPGPGIAAAHRQMAGLLAGNPQVKKDRDGRRQMVAEAMIHETVLSQSIRERTHREGSDEDLAALAESTHQNLMRRQLNLRDMSFGDQGFVRASLTA